MNWSCSECGNLDKTIKEYNESKYCYLYGCKATKTGTICGWCKTDGELKSMGCSFFIDKSEVQPKQLNLFEVLYGI